MKATLLASLVLVGQREWTGCLTIELPFPPFPGLHIDLSDEAWSYHVDVATWSVQSNSWVLDTNLGSDYRLDVKTEAKFLELIEEFGSIGFTEWVA